MENNENLIEELKEMCKPVVKWLEEHADPYTEVSVHIDKVEVKNTIKCTPI